MTRSGPLFVTAALALVLAACGSPGDRPAQGPEARTAQDAGPVGATGPLAPEAIEQATIGAPDPATAGASSGGQATRGRTPGSTGEDDQGAVPASGAAVPASDAGASGPGAPLPDAGLIRLQILLDRSAFSPGVIDGLDGTNLRQAADAWRRANGMSEGGADAALLQRLAAVDAAPVLTRYTVTQADLAGPFSPQPASGDLQALMDAGVGYRSALEALSERFHLTEALMLALNPSVGTLRPGMVLVVPATSAAELPAPVTRIVVDKARSMVMAYADGDRLLAAYPATIGSTERPAPSGRLTVRGVANEPDYTYDPARLSYDRGDERVVVPAGPNNPVGTVWIDLSRDTYGIHGSPDPSAIGKTASNGCVRLTNWDAEQLAAAVRPGVEVIFR